MSQTVKPYHNSQEGKKKQVTTMFNQIADTYDNLNRVITFGIDISWRKKVVTLIGQKKPAIVLDIATGTGDLAIELVKTKAEKVIGLDISPGMLEVGKQKVNHAQLSGIIDMIEGDSEALPFEDNSIDAVTVGFGVRNFENLEKGLSEILRVLKPKGQLVVLETSVPTKFPFRQGYFIHSRFVLPIVGKLFSKDKDAYKYLSKSAAAFPYGKAFNTILEKVGFIEVYHKPQTMGVATIYSGTKK